MTGGMIIGGLILLVAFAFAWARIGAARSERRSIETYGHALGVLGEVARRSDSTGSVRLMPDHSTDSTDSTDNGDRGDIGIAHVGTALRKGGFPSGVTPRIDTRSRGEVPAAAELRALHPVRGARAGDARRPPTTTTVPAAPAVPRISLPLPARPWRFDDYTVESAPTRQLTGACPPASAGSRLSGTRADGAPVEQRMRQASRPFEPTSPGPGDDPAHPGRERPSAVRSVPLDELRRQAGLRRVATATAGTVAIVLVTLAGLQLTGTPGHATRPPRPTSSGQHDAPNGAVPATEPSGGGAGTRGTNGHGRSAMGERLVPSSTTASQVSFRVPARRYLLTFSDTGTTNCWVGVGKGPGSGAWLWTDTLAPGSTTSYAASGPVIVDLGAPRNIRLRVDGLAAVLPGYALSYEVSFTTAAASA